MGVLEAVSAAISGLSVVGKAFGWLRRRLGGGGPERGIAGGPSIGGHVEASAVAGRDIRVKGDLTINAPVASAFTEDEWWAAEGAPRFRLSPNRELNPFRLSMSFQVMTS